MMISRTNSGGYTLLEVSLTISIIVLIFLAFIPTFSGLIHERRFRNATNLILECAAETRAEAKNLGKSISIVFGKSEIQISGGKFVLLSKDMTLFIRKNSDKWILAQRQIWKFAPNGLVEPISLRLERGTSWMEIDIDILTAMVAEERFSF